MQQEFITFFRGTFLRHDPHRFAVMQPQNADRKYNDHAGDLTDLQIAAHLEGRVAYAVPTAQDGLASYLPLDIDAGGEDTAHALLDAASTRGLWAFAQINPQRGRGYVWIPFDDLVNVERIHTLGEQLLAQVNRPGWKIENRATNEDTRLPFARHAWTGGRGQLITQDGQTHDLDDDSYTDQLAAFVSTYRENPTRQLPPPPEAAPTRSASTPSGQGITIAAYNAATDLVHLLESYGAKHARGEGRRLYFCPFHSDSHASLLITRDGDHCKCLSQGSDCPLSAHQCDPFNVFCVGEGLTTAQALRRLNGHPDDPQRGTPGSNPQTPPAAPGRPAPHNELPQAHSAAQRPAAPAIPARMEPRQRNSSELHLPKTCRRVLDVFSQASGHYWRGVPYLAQVLDVDPRTVQRSLRRLEAEELIERQQRGDGHTDIYRLAGGGVAKRVNAKKEAAPAPGEGRHLPPTIDHEIHDHGEFLEARRGGDSGNPPTGQAEHVPAADADGAQCGPAGAVAFAGGAAYVPPQATGWYNVFVQLTQPAPEAEPEQIALPTTEAEPLAEPEPQRPGATKRRRRRDACTNPAQLAGRITAAERKAAKVVKTNPRQARAIRRQVEQMQCQLAMLRAELEAEHDAAQAADAEAKTLDEPPPTGPTSSSASGCPPSSLPGVDYAAVSRQLVARLRALRQQATDQLETVVQ